MSLLKKMIKKRSLLCVLFMITAHTAGMDREEIEDFNLSELFDLNPEVTVASKKSERISDAPGIIVAYTDKDMKNLGYYTIRDLAKITPGYSSMSMIGEQTLTTRGQRVGGIHGSFDNNKHLLMVDGIPVRHLRAGKVPVEEEMSLYGAKRVEFLKGPGSALYGTGAFFGVINVVSQDLQENGTVAKARMSLGTDNLNKSAMASLVSRNDHGQFRVTASVYDKEASGDTCRVRKVANKNEYSDTRDEFRNWDDRNAIFMNLNYTHRSGVGLGFIYNRKSGGLGEYWWGETSQFSEIHWETMIPYVKFQKELTNVLSLNSYLLVNQSIEKVFYPGNEPILTAESVIEHSPSVQYERKFGDLEMLGELTADLGDVGLIIGGINYDMRFRLGSEGSLSTGSYDSYGDKSTTLRFPTSNPFHTVSFYLQYQKDFPVLSGLTLTAGVREDIGITEAFSYNQASPRVGIVQKLTDNLSLKLLYGTALRAPTMKDVEIGEEAVIAMKRLGDSNLDDIPNVGAETIKSYEAGMNLSFDRISGNIAGFYNETSDAINTTVITGNKSDKEQRLPANVEGITVAYGLEAEISGMPISEVKIFVGADYAKSYLLNSLDSKTDSTQVFGVPTGKISGGIMIAPKTKLPFTITPVASVVLGYRQDGKISEGKVMEKNNGRFYTIDMNMTFDPFEHFGFEFALKNLTNNRFYQPGIAVADAGASYLDIQEAGINVAFAVTVRF